MKIAIAFILTIILISFTSITGQEREEEIILPQNIVETIKKAIQSENDGLKKSSMSMISEYKLKQACCSLIEQFGKETSMDYKYLIARVIYEVGCEKSVEEFRLVLKEEQAIELKYFCELLHKNYLFAKN